MNERPKTASDVAEWVREVHEQSTSSTKSSYPGVAANAALTLISVATALLDRQIAAQAATFAQEGGFTERLYRVRRAKGSSRPRYL